jgi:MarR family transcriptional regulator for hemolysin
LTLIGIPNIGITIKSEPDIRRLINAIVSAGNTLLREAGRLFKSHKITAAQFNVLILLSEAPEGLRASDLTAALVVDPSSITYVLDRMEARGWLRRAADHEDRRASRIVLTAAGRDLHGQVAPLYFAALQATLRGFAPDKIGPLTEALGKIQEAAHAAVDTVLATTPRRRRPTRRSNP